MPYLNLPLTGICAVLIGLILSSAFPAIIVFAQELMPGRIGTVTGLFFGFAFGMGGLGAAVLGDLADATSITTVYRLTAFLPAIGLLAWFLPRLERGAMSDGVARPRVAITYCTQCNWLLRAAWMAQELLQTFSETLGEVALVPSTGGIFVITVNDATVWERKADGGFPDVKALKQRVRDRIDRGRDLGHLDRAGHAPT